MKKVLTLLVLPFLLVACAQAETPEAVVEATATVLPTETASPPPSPTPTETPIPEPTPTALPEGWGEGPVPPGRHYMTLEWDPLREKVVIYGGVMGLIQREVWLYDVDKNVWSLEEPQGMVPDRAAHSMIWDSLNERFLVFGGFDNSIAYGVKNDLFSYDPQTREWKLLNPAGPRPVTRARAAVVFDPVRNQMLVFGGTRGGQDESLDDLWAYKVEENRWVPLNPEGEERPESRESMSAVWNPVDEEMLIFGGWDFETPGNRFQQKLWAYDPETNTWRELAKRGPKPLPRWRHGAVWDPTSERMLVFGGCCSKTFYHNDLWAYDPRTDEWSELSPEGEIPPVRNRIDAAWDPEHEAMVIYGGIGQCFLQNDLWLYYPRENRWEQRKTAYDGSPIREGHDIVYDSLEDRMLLFGGCDGSRRQNEVWSYDLTGDDWSLLETTGEVPEPPTRHRAVYNDGKMYVFGGIGSIGHFNDLYTLDMQTGVWEVDDDFPKPSPRADVIMVWDSVNERILVYGGLSTRAENGFYSDIWAYYPDQGEWVELEPEGEIPPARGWGVGAWSDERQELIITGGFNQFDWSKSHLVDTWIFHADENRWEKVASPTPPHRLTQTAVWDEENQVLLMFGGFKFDRTSSAQEVILNELWAFDPERKVWMKLDPEGELPTPRYHHAVTWDSSRGVMLIYGGQENRFLTDLWAYSYEENSWTRIFP